jgi:hypothetical protein
MPRVFGSVSAARSAATADPSPWLTAVNWRTGTVLGSFDGARARRTARACSSSAACESVEVGGDVGPGADVEAGMGGTSTAANSITSGGSVQPCALLLREHNALPTNVVCACGHACVRSCVRSCVRVCARTGGRRSIPSRSRQECAHGPCQAAPNSKTPMPVTLEHVEFQSMSYQGAVASRCGHGPQRGGPSQLGRQKLPRADLHP